LIVCGAVGGLVGALLQRDDPTIPSTVSEDTGLSMYEPTMSPTYVPVISGDEYVLLPKSNNNYEFSLVSVSGDGTRIVAGGYDAQENQTQYFVETWFYVGRIGQWQNTDDQPEAGSGTIPIDDANGEPNSIALSYIGSIVAIGMLNTQFTEEEGGRGIYMEGGRLDGMYQHHRGICPCLFWRGYFTFGRWYHPSSFITQ
jgi:hypothetical protein